MKRQACQLILIGAALAAANGAAGGDIVKCIDPDGHVTLTDQPCEPGAATIRLAGEAQASRPAPEPYPTLPALLPPRPVPLRRHVSTVPHAPLARDVATVQAARAQQLLIDAGNKDRPPQGLARLD
ncbi:DUF4124 domain-containing protein [Massilia horti]|uniref:DUF4124 domain-containing protein n=1 Tax=Massilia horti TaxID=2562153 RepID=A0A4Y9SY00_9BURK|nr:DUF4124 domain-containing protein [Massilia horti]TFW31521.1 DUF4124 domain-containing protein [Massilia horti]